MTKVDTATMLRAITIISLIDNLGSLIVLNPRLLIHFETALRHGNLHSAAVELGISQPGLSKSIKTLEAQIGSRLFDRSSRGVEPTMLGQALATHAKVIASELLAAEATVEHHQGGSRRSVRMGAGPSFGDWLTPIAIGEFRRRFPTTRLWVTVGLREHLHQRLHAGEIDFYVARADETGRDGTHQEILYEDRLAVCCRPEHPLNTGRPVEVSELAGFEWAFIESQGNGLARPELLRVFLEHDLGAPKTALESDSTNLVYSLARQSDVLCLRPTFKEHRIGSVGGLIELPVPPIFPTIKRAIMFRDVNRLSGTDLAMVNVLREVASDLRTNGEPEPFGDAVAETAGKQLGLIGR